MENALGNPQPNGSRRHSRLSYVIGYGLAFLILALSIDKFQRRLWPDIARLFSKPVAVHVNQLPADVREILEQAETLELIRFAGVETLDVDEFDRIAVQDRVTLELADRERVRSCIEQGIANHFGIEPTIHFKPAFGVRAVVRGKSAGLIFGDNGLLLIYRNDQNVDAIRTSTTAFELFAEILQKQV